MPPVQCSNGACRRAGGDLDASWSFILSAPWRNRSPLMSATRLAVPSALRAPYRRGSTLYMAEGGW
jgi:hypothetical protein